MRLADGKRGGKDDGRRVRRIAREQLNKHVRAPRAHTARILAHSRDRRGDDLRPVVIVKSDERDLFRDADPLLVEVRCV